MNKILLFVCLCSLSCLIACKSKQGKQPENKITATDPKSQIEAISKEINEKGANAALYVQRAKLYDNTKQLELAIRDAEKALTLDSTKGEYYNLLGDLYMKRPYEKGALLIYEAGTKVDPNNKEAFLKLGKLYFNIKDRDNSFKNLNGSIRIDNRNAEAFFYRGLNYIEVGMPDKAITNFQQAIDIDPKYFDAYVKLGILFAAKKDRKAADYYSSALQIKPDDALTLYDRGRFYQDIDSIRLAIKDYEAIIATNPTHKWANYNLGYINYNKKNYDKAASFFSTAIVSDPDYAEAYLGRSLCYTAMKKSKLASTDMQFYEEKLKDKGAATKKPAK